MKIIKQTQLPNGFFFVLLEVPPSKRLINIFASNTLKKLFLSDCRSLNLYLSFPCLRFYILLKEIPSNSKVLPETDPNPPTRYFYYLQRLRVYIYSNEKNYLLPLPNISYDNVVCMNHCKEYDSIQSCIDGTCQSFFNSEFNFESTGVITHYYDFTLKLYCEFLKKWLQATKDGIGLEQIIELKEAHPSDDPWL